MAAPMNMTFSRLSNRNFKFFQCLSHNIQNQQNISRLCLRSHSNNAFFNRTHWKCGVFNRFITNVTLGLGITGSAAGLYLYSTYSNSISKVQLFPKVQASTEDKSNNFRYNIADAVDIASPAVVFLRVKRYSRHGFHEESQGSGFIVKKDGLILTNAHVVRDNGQITVKMKNGREFIGTVHAVDKISDLATIKINATDLPVIKLGDSSSLRAGEWVVALGCPLSLNFTVTVGIVSSKHRAGAEIGVRTRDNIGYIQTDAAITVGNSGGPLINLAGEAIGINTWTVKDGISFAIPSDYAKQFVERAEAYAPKAQKKSGWFGSGASETKKSYYLGITMLTLTPDLVVALREQYAGFPHDCDHGVIVQSLKLDSPAYRAGLQAGDVILEINGKDVQAAGNVYEAVSTGEEMLLTVKRHRQTLKLRVTPLQVN